MKEWIERLARGESLGEEAAEEAVHRIMAGEASPVEMSAFLVALRTRGETPAEVAGGVRAMRRSMVEVPIDADRAVDTCGTGGGSLTTFNISTVAALVAAGGGVGVAKHGNRSYSSRCGSADLLEALGVEIELPPEALAELFEEVGLVFMYAPAHHPAMRHVAPVRRELGIPTIFNLLGPLTSPARVRRQVVGVAEPDLVPLVAEGLRALGHERAIVVHGAPGMDEFSPLGESRGLLLEDGELAEFRVEPAEFGWEGFEPEELAGGEPAENGAIAEALLRGERGGAARAAVELNAAAAFWVAGRAGSLEEGVERAAESIDSGAALETLEKLRAGTRRRAASAAGG